MFYYYITSFRRLQPHRTKFKIFFTNTKKYKRELLRLLSIFDTKIVFLSEIFAPFDREKFSAFLGGIAVKHTELLLYKCYILTDIRNTKRLVDLFYSLSCSFVRTSPHSYIAIIRKCVTIWQEDYNGNLHPLGLSAQG